MHAILEGKIPAPSEHRADVPRSLDAVVLKGLCADPAKRFANAREMASALEDAMPAASATRVSDWIDATASDVLKQRAERVTQVESLVTPVDNVVAASDSIHPDAETRVDVRLPSRPDVEPRPTRRPALLAVGVGVAVVVGAMWLLSSKAGQSQTVAAASAAPAVVAPSAKVQPSTPTRSAIPPSSEPSAEPSAGSNASASSVSSALRSEDLPPVETTKPRATSPRGDKKKEGSSSSFGDLSRR